MLLEASDNPPGRGAGMDDNDYDEALRYLSRRVKAPLLHWFLQLDATHVDFQSWLDPVLVWPGMKERVCDLIARLANLDRGGLPTACIVEFQTVPDPRMFGRLLVAGGLCWLDVKPADLPGDRFELSAVVVNLTGQGDCARHMTLGTSEWTLKPYERNLETMDAKVVLEDIASDKAPREVLALISVMKNGDDPDTIKRWGEIAGPETDLDRRGDYALVELFAGAVGRRELWRKALEGFKMNESPVAREWRAEARREGEREGERKGKIEGKIDVVLRILQRRRITLPEDLLARIRACTDSEKIDRWVDSAAVATTLEEFRRDGGF
jgi:hypothetical protein